MNAPSPIQYLLVHLIEADPSVAAKCYSLNEVDRLAQQIRKIGVKPIRVREVNSRWFAVGCERKRQACIAAGLELVPCVIVTRDRQLRRRTD